MNSSGNTGKPTGRPNIVLTGFMGTGKTTVGRLIARRLDREFVDTDEEIQNRENIPIPRIFELYGEKHFRNLETKLCKELTARRDLVIATGGGMPVDPENRRLLNSSGLVVCLDCTPSEILSRLDSASGRPMLMGADIEQRITGLLKEREQAYTALPFHVDTSGLSIDDVTQRILNLIESLPADSKFLSVATQETGGYTIAIGPRLHDLVGEMLRDRGITSRVAVVTDSNVESLYLDRVMMGLRTSGFRPFDLTVPAGEQTKSLTQLGQILSGMVENGMDRLGAVVALGGGVIGDLAGFAAATYMRGVSLVQCPTTLLAMVDSSVGGKTGVDLPQGKNLVGAFKEPVAVAADTLTLGSLPHDQIRAGMAELIKHAIIADAELFTELEASSGKTELNAELVARSVSVKIRVVEEDPLESGRRAVLNLGHTVGHALEKCSGYSLGHGDAVSVGLVAAARMASRMGLCEDYESKRVENLLAVVGLPIRHCMNVQKLIGVMKTDKKVVEGRIPFVLMREIGVAEHDCDVPSDLVREVLESLKETS